MFRFVQVMLCVHCEPRKAGVKFFVCATYLANKDDSDSDSDSDSDNVRTTAATANQRR